MTWQYQLVEHKTERTSQTFETYWAVHEAYDLGPPEGKVVGSPRCVTADSPEGVLKVLKMMLSDCEQQIRKQRNSRRWWLWNRKAD